MATSKPVVPTGFFSYRHLDGADRAYLEKLWQNLQTELFTLVGHRIRIWRDVDEIEWGKEWGKAIDAGLKEAAFFIPVITPGYLFSEGCRDEFEKFARFEKERKRTDLILPLIYVRPDVFDDPEAKETDAIVRLCVDRQYADWEDLRHLGDEQLAYRVKLTKLGKRIRSLLETVGSVDLPASPSKKPKHQPRVKGGRRAKVAKTSEKEAVQDTVDKSSVSKQQTLLVNRLGPAGTFQTISKALDAAQGGDRILVAPGRYSEPIVLIKPVEIIGEGNLGDVTIELKDSNVVQSGTTFGRLQNLAVRQNGEERNQYFAISVRSGSLDIDKCEITSASISCIGVTENAEVRVRRCRLHGSPQAGIAFFKQAGGVVEECEIFDNGYGGIAIQGVGHIIIRANKLRDGRTAGIRCMSGTPLIEDNDIYANAWGGIDISDDANPTIRRNRIYDGAQSGIVVHSEGRATITENEIFGNAFTGIEVTDNGTPTISNNHVHENKQGGLFFHHGGSGIVENNRIEKNGRDGIHVADEANPQVRKNRFVANAAFGAQITSGGRGIFEENVFTNNERGDKEIATAAEPNVSWNE